MKEEKKGKKTPCTFPDCGISAAVIANVLQCDYLKKGQCCLPSKIRAKAKHKGRK